MADKKRKPAALFMAAILAAVLLGGCAGSTADSEKGTDSEIDGMTKNSGSGEGVDQNLELTGSSLDQEFSDRDKNGSYEESEAVKITLADGSVKADGDGCTVSGNVLTISSEGIYLLSGSLSEGQVIVDAADTDKVQIVLSSVDIHCETSAAIYVKNADKVFLTLAKGTKNTLGGGSEYEQTDDNTVDGVVFSKDDLTLNGSGSLQIEAAYKHGIVSKNDLVITGGGITVQAVGQCLSGKDCVKISGGTFTLSGQGKGIKSENTDETEKGNIYVAGGVFAIDTEDDAFHASGSIVADGGTFSIKSGDDAFHSDLDVVVNDGNITVESCYEGLEGQRVVVNGGELSLTAEDDGVNAAKSATEAEEADVRGGPGDGGMENEADAYIKITGGSLTVSAQGDGLDSNGSLFITGGTTYVNGPVDSGNGALDYNGGARITGGVIIAVGGSGMAQGLGDSSTQCSVLQNLDESQEAGTAVVLTDADGKELLNWTPEKQYSSVVISCPKMQQGETYTLTTGSESAELTLESVVTSNAASGGQMGVHMGRGGAGQMGGKSFGGEFPEGGEAPEGMEPPVDGEAQEGTEQSEDGEVPEGPEQSGDGEVPEGTEQSGDGGTQEV